MSHHKSHTISHWLLSQISNYYTLSAGFLAQKQNISYGIGTGMWQAKNKGVNMQFPCPSLIFFTKDDVAKQRSENG